MCLTCLACCCCASRSEPVAIELLKKCDWQVDADGCVVVRTTRAVRRGEELLLSYVDPALPGAERRKRLRASFFFECKCAACRRDVG